MDVDANTGFNEHILTPMTLRAIESITGNRIAVRSLTKINELIELIKVDMAGLTSQQEKREQLLYLFYQQLGFGGDWRKWLELDSIMLDRVVETRNGIPISLGTLFIHFAAYFDVAVTGILFPAQFVLRFGEGPDYVYVDPTDGKVLSRHDLEVRLRGIEGNHAMLTDSSLEEASYQALFLQILKVMKAGLIRDEHFSQALRCVDIILTIEPDEPYEIRDRGFLLQQLDCNKLASDDFSFFIEHCPDDPLTHILKAQVDVMSAEIDIIH